MGRYSHHLLHRTCQTYQWLIDSDLVTFHPAAGVTAPTAVFSLQSVSMWRPSVKLHPAPTGSDLVSTAFFDAERPSRQSEAQPSTRIFQTVPCVVRTASAVLGRLWGDCTSASLRYPCRHHRFTFSFGRHPETLHKDKPDKHWAELHCTHPAG